MSNARDVLEELVRLSRRLGEPERDLVILGEGNTSALNDDGTFWVKGSGTQLATIDADGFVRVDLAKALDVAKKRSLTDDEVSKALEGAKVDPSVTRRPSVETILHALALDEEGISFVGHTHPVAVNAIMCSAAAPEIFGGRLFPDEIVVCGPAPAYVPYVDPGPPLALAVQEAMYRYADRWGQLPKALVMQNHGLIALGGSAKEVDNITAMFVKTCRVLAGTMAFGGPRYLTPANVRRIHTRPDELYRRRELGQG